MNHDGLPVPEFVKDDIVSSLDRPGQKGIITGIATPPQKLNGIGDPYSDHVYWVRFGDREVRLSERFLGLWTEPLSRTVQPPPDPPCPLGLRVTTPRGPGTIVRPLGRSTGWPPGSVVVEVDPVAVQYRGEMVQMGGPMYCTPGEMEVR